MVVQKTSVFPAGRDFVFQKLQQLETLQIIAKPYAAFEPIGDTVSTWAVGGTSAYRFRLFDVMEGRKYGFNIVSQLLKLFVIFPAVSALAAWICTLF